MILASHFQHFKHTHTEHFIYFDGDYSIPISALRFILAIAENCILLIPSKENQSDADLLVLRSRYHYHSRDEWQIICLNQLCECVLVIIPFFSRSCAGIEHGYMIIFTALHFIQCLQISPNFKYSLEWATKLMETTTTEVTIYLLG